MKNIAFVLFIPHQIPVARVLLVHTVGIPDDSNKTEGVGHGVEIVRIVVQIPEALADVLVIGDVVEIQRKKHSLICHPGNHIVGRNYNVIAYRSAGKFRIHIFVGCKGCVVDFHRRTVVLLIPFFETLDCVKAVFRAVGNIFSPVIDVQNRFGWSADVNQDCKGNRENGADRSGDTDTTLLYSRTDFFLFCRFLNDRGRGVDEVRHYEESKDRKEDDGTQRVHLRRYGLLRHVVDPNRKGLESVAGGEVADDKVVQTQREGHDQAGHDSRHNLGNLHFQKGSDGSASEIHGSLRKRTVHLLQLRKNLKNDIGQTEGDMCNEHGRKIQTCRRTEQSPDENKHQHERNTRDDIGINHRDVRYRIIGCTNILAAEPVNPDCGCGPHDS